MSSATLARLVSHYRGICGRAAAAPDSELLRRFVRSRDADAFAELLSRHAGIVWGVCRRTLPQEVDCEDAFQATFLALARNAQSIDPARPLGAWLHAVAVRVARRALGRTLRRQTADLPAECVGPADVTGDVAARDLFRAVDEEIARLPAFLRVPVVLCCLEGRARDEAAEALGCSVLAVKSRLERARHLLRQSLARRGIPLPAAFFVIGLGTSAVGAGLRSRAVEAALGSASPAVTRLAAAGVPGSGALMLATAAAITVLAVGVGAAGLRQAPPQDTPPAAKETSAPKTDPVLTRVDKFGDPLPDGAVRRFGTLRFRHESVAHLVFTPDGKRVIAGIGREPLAVFDAADGRKLRTVGDRSANNNYGFALSPDGKQVFTTGYHLALFDLDTGTKVRQFEAVRCSAVAVSPDGKKVACVREHRPEAMVFDVATGKKLADLNLKDMPATTWGPYVRDLAFSPDGQIVAAVVSEAKELKPNQITIIPAGLRVWDAATGNPLGLAGPANEPPTAFAFVPDTKQLAYLDKGRAIHLWDTEANKEVRTLAPAKEDGVTSLAVSADGKRIAGYRETGEVVIYDLKDGRELRRVQTGGQSIGPVVVALSPDGSLVACGKMYGDSSVRVWDVGTGRERLADAGHRGPAELSPSADGKTLVSRRVGEVFRWDLATGEGNAAPDDQKDPDGYVRGSNLDRLKYRTPRYQFTLDMVQARIEVHTRDGSKLVAKAPIPQHYQRGHAFSADGRHLAVSFQDRGYTVILWTPGERAEPFQLNGHPDACQQMLFTHDGKYLIVAAGTHNMYKTETVFVYETATGKLVRKLATNSAPGKMLLTADDRTLITGGLWNDATVRAWDLPTGRELATMVDPAVKVPSVTEPRGGEVAAVGGLALSADERFLTAVTGHEGSTSVSVWDTGSWKLVKAFPPARPRVEPSSVAVAHDGRSVFVAYHDSTILQWDVSGKFGKRAAAAITATRRDELWRDLAEPAEWGYAAAWELLDHPAEAVELIESRVSPARPLDATAVKELVRKLGADSFREREESAKKLVALGDAVIPVIREVSGGNLSAEGKERADKVIAALTAGLTPDQLRLRRAVAVLEWSERPEAVDYLQKLAGGDPSARVSVDAKAALARLKRARGVAD
jgi:RNA polymerase sigma factor (sigma-70 family)